MLVDRYAPEDVFACVPEVAAQTDPVLKALDWLLQDDLLYQQVRADLGKRYRYTLAHGGTPPRWKSSCACSSVSISLSGATGKRKSASATAGAALVLSGVF